MSGGPIGLWIFSSQEGKAPPRDGDPSRGGGVSGCWVSSDTTCDTADVEHIKLDAIAWFQRGVSRCWRGMQESNLRPSVS